jgi:hypothetical protein
MIVAKKPEAALAELRLTTARKLIVKLASRFARCSFDMDLRVVFSPSSLCRGMVVPRSLAQTPVLLSL